MRDKGPPGGVPDTAAKKTRIEGVTGL